jgi:hypothetical protein
MNIKDRAGQVLIGMRSWSHGVCCLSPNICNELSDAAALANEKSTSWLSPSALNNGLKISRHSYSPSEHLNSVCVFIGWL